MAQGKKVDWGLVEKLALGQKMLIEGNWIYWEKFGHGPQVVLCIAGVLGDVASCFHPVWEKMNVEHFTLIGLDLPGYGYSRPPDRNYRDEEIQLKDARVSMELMKRLEFPRFSIVTHSGGGYVATLLSSWNPDAVEKIVYCNAPFRSDARLVRAVQFMADLDCWDERQRNYFLSRYGKAYTEMVLKSWSDCVVKAANTVKSMDIYVEHLKNVKVPALAISALKDKLVPAATALEMKKYIPHLRIHTVPGGFHSHLTFLDEFIQVSQDFLMA